MVGEYLAEAKPFFRNRTGLGGGDKLFLDLHVYTCLREYELNVASQRSQPYKMLVAHYLRFTWWRKMGAFVRVGQTRPEDPIRCEAHSAIMGMTKMITGGSSFLSVAEPSNAPSLAIKLCNGLSIQLDGVPLKFASQRAELLLVWLALHPGPHRRELLATMLWDDREQQRVLGNLRTLLARLPRPAKPFLQQTSRTVELLPNSTLAVDLLTFDQLRADGELAAAAALLTGEPLAGIHVEQSEGLTAWMMTVRETYAQKGIMLLARLAQTTVELGQAILYAQRLLQLDPMREASYRLLMRLLARDGRRHEALALYERCQTMLAAEFSLPPEPATDRLAKRLRANGPAQPVLPRSPTPFVGREVELARLSELLDGGEARLVTILGAGGMGKTRLAVEFARQQPQHKWDGVAFVPLADFDAGERIAAHIAANLAQAGLIGDLTGQLSPRQFLQYQLADQEMLLLLDNCEQLPSLGPLLAELLDHCPGLRVLATSRRRLGVAGEYVLALAGLSLARAEASAAISPAANLFRQIARQAGTQLPDTPAQQDLVAQICQAVAGMPLALELAARWSSLYDLSRILSEIQRNLAFLADQDGQLPARHRSLLAVCQHTWTQLPQAAQRHLQRLLIFQGPFTAAAAEAVAAADGTQLARLLDQALLQRQTPASAALPLFSWHPQLRAYVWEWTGPGAELIAEAERRHCRYYLNLLASEAVQNEPHNMALPHEWDNIQLAWRNGVSLALWAELRAGLDTLLSYWRRHGLFQEAVAALQLATEAELPADLLGPFLLALARFQRNQAQFGAAFATLERYLEQYGLAGRYAETISAHLLWGEMKAHRNELADAEERLNWAAQMAVDHDAHASLAAARRLLGYVAHRRGQFNTALDLLRQASEYFLQAGDKSSLARTDNILGMAYSVVGDKPKALLHIRRSLIDESLTEDKNQLVRGHVNLGHLLVSQGAFQEGLGHLRRGQQLARQIGAWRGIAYADHTIGATQIVLGQYGRARQSLHKAAMRFAELELRVELAAGHNLQAKMHLYMGQPKAAGLYAAEALQLAQATGFKQVIAGAYSYLGYASLSDQDYEQAEAAFADALALQQALQNNVWQVESLTGQAAVARLAGDGAKALSLVHPILPLVTVEALSSWLRPFAVLHQLVLICQPEEPEQARRLLQLGLDTLTGWAADLPAAEQSAFWQAVYDHQQLVQLSQRIHP